MKNFQLLFSFCFLFSISLFAQQNAREFGDVNANDFEDSYADLSEDPHAVILYDRGDAKFLYNGNRGFEIETVYHMRKHVLNKSELKQGIISLRYYKGKSTTGDRVFKVKANTYNLVDGKVVVSKLGRKEVYDERINDDYSQKKISLPDVKVGSIIEYTYTMQRTLNTQKSPSTWYFQGNLPVRWSEYNITIPSVFYYQIMMGGYLPLAENQRDEVNSAIDGLNLTSNSMQYHFAVRDAKAFKNEPFITTNKDYISKIEFELSSIDMPGQPQKNFNTSWEELDKTLMESDYWGKYMNQKFKIKELAAPFKTIADAQERAESIYEYVTSNFEWNDYVGVWASSTAKKVIQEKRGSASSLNLLTLALFKEAGLDANPVIMSTRRNGLVNTSYPLLDRFNYTIVALNIEDKKTLVDVSDPLLPMGALPERCLNQTGREIINGTGNFLTLTTTASHTEYEEINASFDIENAALVGIYKSNSSGYSARDLRAHIEEAGNSEFEKQLKEGYGEWEIEDIQIENEENISTSLKTSFAFTKEDGGIMDDMIYLDPLPVGKINDNPFKAEERAFPVDFAHKTNHTMIAKYKIPDGFQVEEKPKAVNITLPENAGKFTYSVVINNNELAIISRILLNKAIFSADEYPYLKQFYDLIVEKHAEQIVLSRVEE